MDSSTVYSWLYHQGVIDERRSLETPYRMEQYAALMWRILEEDTSFRGDSMTMYDGGRYAFPSVTFIGPAGETRFDAGASWDELGGVQAVRPQPSLPEHQDNNALPEIPNVTLQDITLENNSMHILLPPLDAMVIESPRFSPVFCMAYGGGENEVDEFGDADVDDDSEEFLMEEYELEDLEE